MRLYFIKDIKKSHLTCPMYLGKKVYVDTGSVIDNRIVDFDEFEYLKKPSRANVCVATGDVLFAKMQNSIKVLEIDNVSKDYIFSTGFYCFRDSRILPSFLRYFFLSSVFNQQKDKLCYGATMKAINDEGMSQISVNVPSMEEQKKIVDLLDSLTQSIENDKEQMKRIDELVESYFIKLFGDPVENSLGLPVLTLNDVCSKITDGTHDTPKKTQDGYLLVTGKNIRENDFVWDDKTYVSEQDHKNIYRRCNPEKGDVLYTNIGANYGTALFNNLGFEFSMKNVALLKPSKNVVHGIFLWKCLNMMKANILAKNRTGGAQTFMGLSTIKNIEIPVPDYDTQLIFVKILEELNELKATLQLRQNTFNELLEKKLFELFITEGN